MNNEYFTFENEKIYFKNLKCIEIHKNFELYTDYKYKYRINNFWKNISNINYEINFNDSRLETSIYKCNVINKYIVRTKWFKNLILIKDIISNSNYEKILRDIFNYKYNQNISLKNYGYISDKYGNCIIRFDEKTTNKYYSIMKDKLVFDGEIELIDLYYGFNNNIYIIDENHNIKEYQIKFKKSIKELRIIN